MKLCGVQSGELNIYLYVSISISVFLQLPGFCTELHNICSPANSTTCLLVSVCLYVRESERPPAVSSCCLRGSQRLPPWNRRRRGTELGSERPAKTPLQKLWGKTRRCFNRRHMHSMFQSWHMASIYRGLNNELNQSHPMLLKKCFLLLIVINFNKSSDILYVCLIELWIVAFGNLNVKTMSCTGFPLLWLQHSRMKEIKPELTFL